MNFRQGVVSFMAGVFLASCHGIAGAQEFPLGKRFLDELGQNGEALADKPLDIRRFVEDAAACEHFAGEEAYDEARRLEIISALDRFCGNARTLSVPLKEKYRKEPGVLQMLSICDAGASTACSSF